MRPKVDPWGLAAAGLGFALRAGLLFRYPDIEGRGDETVHYILGVLTSHLGADAIAYWAPLFEFFQAAAYRLLGPEPWNAKIFQVLVSTATIPLVYALAASIGGRRAARIAAFGMALYPTHVLFSHYLYNETLYLFLLTACVHLFHRRPGGPSRAEVVGSGVLFGLAALTRSVAVTFLPVWVAWSFLRGRRREALQVIGLALTAFLVISPWTLRNYLRYDRFLLVDPIVGFVAYYAFNQMPLTRDVGYRQRFVSERERCKGPVLSGQEPLPTVDELRAWFPPSAEHFLSTPERLRHQILTTRIELSVNLADVQRCEIERGLAYARAHPWHILHETLQRFYAFWGPNSKALRHVHERTYPDGPLRKESFPVLEWIVVLPTLVVFTLAILHYGLPRIHPAAEWIALFTTYYTAIHMLAGAWSRYRLPLTGFAIAVGAVWLAAPRLPAGRRRAVVVGALLLLYLGVAIHYLVFTLP